ncbi:MAG: hypothetical protein AAF937_10710 [Planctomycetota bacterium]
MASGGGKNIVLIVIAVGAIGGAAYLLSQSMGGGGTVDRNENVYFIKMDTQDSANPVGVTMKRSEYQSRIKNRRPILIDGSAEVIPAGLCPEGKYYPLGGHGEKPEVCACGNSLANYDVHGKPTNSG